jgi:hypothetical protein
MLGVLGDGAAANGQAPQSVAGDTSDPSSATQQSDDLGFAGGPGDVTVEEVESGSSAVGENKPQIFTSEDSDENKSERGNDAQTPADGTLG